MRQFFNPDLQLRLLEFAQELIVALGFKSLLQFCIGLVESNPAVSFKSPAVSSARRSGLSARCGRY
jgi:hypothetical protein